MTRSLSSYEDAPASRRLWRAVSRTGIALLSCAGLAACSLLTINSPERPLSTRDLNTRLLTRQFSADFVASVESCADDIAAAHPGTPIERAALRWKLIATVQSQSAALQLAPLMALLDTWTFALEMQLFLSPGAPGGDLFGAEQPRALALATDYADAAQAMAHHLLKPKEFQAYQEFVNDYTREYPFVNLKFVRPSVVQLWVLKGGPDVKLVDSLGTIPEALADTADRMRMLGETLPSQSMWRTELALQDSGASSQNVHAALLRLDERLARMSAAAEAAPELVHEAVGDVRHSVLDVLNRLDASSAATIQALRIERAALSETVSTERAALLTAADVQRRAITADVGTMADRLVASSGEQVRHLAREVLLLLTLLAAVVLGLPFGFGYLLGRAHRRRTGSPD
jgi:hypothetical protein